MKKVLSLLAFLLFIGTANAQNPFEKFGYTPKIGTLSKGKYIEHFDTDSIVQIGSVLFNPFTKQITGFVVLETEYSEATLKPEIVSRWLSPDPLAEEFYEWSPYNFVKNNPVLFVDPDGRFAMPFTDLFDKNGNKIGDDGVVNGVNVVVNNDQLASQVKSAFQQDGTVSLLDDQFSFTGADISVLPSDAAFGEALNVLDRTLENGGLSEESSIVYKNGQVIQGPTGDPVQLGVDSHAKTKLPGIFPGTTASDVEVSIHSHPTQAKVVGNQVFGGNARNPTPADKTAFSQFRTNIIVGPLGQASATQGIDKQTGKSATTITKPRNGVVIFGKGSTESSFEFSVRQVQKIIKN